MVLASATPSLESLWNAETGRYHWLKLQARHGAAVMPDIGLIDMRQTPPERDHWLSPPLVRAMVETLGRGEQTLLFLNRRGYAPLVLNVPRLRPEDDRAGHRFLAGGASLHRPVGVPPHRLFHPQAQGLSPLRGCRQPGVHRAGGWSGWRRRRAALFPEAGGGGVLLRHGDGRGGRARAGGPHGEQGEIDILVATQAAAKGHNFPNLTLVGVVDADLGLRGGDLRAGERTYQLLAQATWTGWAAPSVRGGHCCRPMRRTTR